MKTIFLLFAGAALAVAGCTTRNGNHVGGRVQGDEFARTQTVTGSNVPTPPGQLPDSPVSANTPRNSLSREKPSLYPTEPVVGRTPNTEPGTRDVNTGAGPAGGNPVVPINQGNQ